MCGCSRSTFVGKALRLLQRKRADFQAKVPHVLPFASALLPYTAAVQPFMVGTQLEMAGTLTVDRWAGGVPQWICQMLGVHVLVPEYPGRLLLYPAAAMRLS